MSVLVMEHPGPWSRARETASIRMDLVEEVGLYYLRLMVPRGKVRDISRDTGGPYSPT